MAIQKRPPLFNLINQVKLWPSKRGVLHGVKHVESFGRDIKLTSHCGRIIVIKESRRGRAARWLRNGWIVKACEHCRIPAWKVKRFSRGSKLRVRG